MHALTKVKLPELFCFWFIDAETFKSRDDYTMLRIVKNRNLCFKKFWPFSAKLMA